MDFLTLLQFNLFRICELLACKNIRQTEIVVQIKRTQRIVTVKENGVIYTSIFSKIIWGWQETRFFFSSLDICGFSFYFVRSVGIIMYIPYGLFVLILKRFFDRTTDNRLKLMLRMYFNYRIKLMYKRRIKFFSSEKWTNEELWMSKRQSTTIQLVQMDKSMHYLSTYFSYRWISLDQINTTSILYEWCT